MGNTKKKKQYIFNYVIVKHIMLIKKIDYLKKKKTHNFCFRGDGKIVNHAQTDTDVCLEMLHTSKKM